MITINNGKIFKFMKFSDINKFKKTRIRRNLSPEKNPAIQAKSPSSSQYIRQSQANMTNSPSRIARINLMSQSVEEIRNWNDARYSSTEFSKHDSMKNFQNQQMILQNTAKYKFQSDMASTPENKNQLRKTNDDYNQSGKIPRKQQQMSFTKESQNRTIYLTEQSSKHFPTQIIGNNNQVNQNMLKTSTKFSRNDYLLKQSLNSLENRLKSIQKSDDKLRETLYNSTYYNDCKNAEIQTFDSGQRSDRENNDYGQMENTQVLPQKTETILNKINNEYYFINSKMIVGKVKKKRYPPIILKQNIVRNKTSQAPSQDSVQGRMQTSSIQIESHNTTQQTTEATPILLKLIETFDSRNNLNSTSEKKFGNLNIRQSLPLYKDKSRQNQPYSTYFKDIAIKEKSPFANIFLPEMKKVPFASNMDKAMNTVIEFNKSKEQRLMTQTLHNYKQMNSDQLLKQRSLNQRPYNHKKDYATQDSFYSLEQINKMHGLRISKIKANNDLEKLQNMHNSPNFKTLKQMKMRGISVSPWTKDSEEDNRSSLNSTWTKQFKKINKSVQKKGYNKQSRNENKEYIVMNDEEVQIDTQKIYSQEISDDEEEHSIPNILMKNHYNN